MGDAGLVDLARRFVELSDELETVRGEIKRAVLNGAGENRPFSPAVRQRPAGKAAEEAEKAIVKVLEDKPNLGTSALAKATSASVNTTKERLKRLRAKGTVTGGGAEGWRTTAPP